MERIKNYLYKSHKNLCFWSTATLYMVSIFLIPFSEMLSFNKTTAFLIGVFFTAIFGTYCIGGMSYEEAEFEKQFVRRR